MGSPRPHLTQLFPSRLYSCWFLYFRGLGFERHGVRWGPSGPISLNPSLFCFFWFACFGRVGRVGVLVVFCVVVMIDNVGVQVAFCFVSIHCSLLMPLM